MYGETLGSKRFGNKRYSARIFIEAVLKGHKSGKNPIYNLPPSLQLEGRDLANWSRIR